LLSQSKSTQAYKLYTEVNKPVQVAIELGLSEREATRYTQSTGDRHLYKLHSFYKEEIQKQYSKIKDELEVIEYKRVMSKHELDNMNNQIVLLGRSMYQLSATCNNKRNDIACLQNQIQVLG
jgi:Mg2+ and Co2+ transporter CorA